MADQKLSRYGIFVLAAWCLVRLMMAYAYADSTDRQPQAIAIWAHTANLQSTTPGWEKHYSTLIESAQTMKFMQPYYECNFKSKNDFKITISGNDGVYAVSISTQDLAVDGFLGGGIEGLPKLTANGRNSMEKYTITVILRQGPENISLEKNTQGNPKLLSNPNWQPIQCTPHDYLKEAVQEGWKPLRYYQQITSIYAKWLHSLAPLKIANPNSFNVQTDDLEFMRKLPITGELQVTGVSVSGRGQEKKATAIIIMDHPVDSPISLHAPDGTKAALIQEKNQFVQYPEEFPFLGKGIEISQDPNNPKTTLCSIDDGMGFGGGLCFIW